MSKRKIGDVDVDVDEHDHGSEEPRNKRRDISTTDLDDTQNGSASAVTTVALLSYHSGVTQRTPAFQQPTPLTTFSYIPTGTNDRTFELGNASMKYFVPPPPHAQLKYGYERWVRRPEGRGRLDSLLRALKSVVEKGFEVGGVRVVCWRGVVTKILTAPYAARDDRDGPWEMNVMRLGGTFYFEEHLSSAKLREKNALEPKQRMQMYYGYAFESYCTSTTPPSQHPSHQNVGGQRHPRGWGGDVDTNEQWCCVVKTKLGDRRIVVGGEVDCVDGDYTGRTDNLVELKTSMRIRGEQDSTRFERKLLKFYFQSFLLGVPRIVVGFRTPSGELTSTQTFRTMELPRLVRGKPGSWDPAQALEWGDRFFEFLERSCTSTEEREGEGEGRVWRVTFTPGGGVEMRALSDREEMRDVERDSEKDTETDVSEGGGGRVGFLPRWYYDFVSGLRLGRGDTALVPKEAASEKESDAGPGTRTFTSRPSDPGPIPGWKI